MLTLLGNPVTHPTTPSLVGCGAAAIENAAAGTIAEYNFRGKPDKDGKLQVLPTFTEDYWDRATVGHTAEALPRDWGIDRFPCTAGHALSMFREGDFDYPYLLKMVDQVGWQAAQFLYLNPFLDGERKKAMCVENAGVDPVRSAVYYASVTTTFDFQESNKPAFKIAEAKLTADALAAGKTPLDLALPENKALAAELGGPAIGAFMAAGGDKFVFAEQKMLLASTLSADAPNTAGLGTATAAAVGYLTLNPTAGLTATAIAWATTYMGTEGTGSPSGSDQVLLDTVLAGALPFAADATVAAIQAETASMKVQLGGKALLAAAATAARLTKHILAPWVSTTATNIVTAAGAKFTLESQSATAGGSCGNARTGQFETFFALFGGIGFSWRGSLGDHWTFDPKKGNRDRR
jgi:hypothetical protein